MLPLAFIISEIFHTSAGQLELDLGISVGKTWPVSQCPPDFKIFSKMVIVPLCLLEHDLVLHEQERDQFGDWDRGLCQGCLSLGQWWQWQWWSCVPEQRKAYEIHSKGLLNIGNEKEAG